jgi:DHA2 family multidrug resistance protein
MSHALGGMDAAYQSLAGTIQQQAFVMTYNDIFWGMGLLTLLTVPLVFFLRPLPKGLSLAMH